MVVKKYLMLFCICTLMPSATAWCGKLIEDELPGEKTLFNDNAGNATMPSVNKTECTVSDSVYVKFEEKVKILDKQQLSRIENNFIKLLKTAVQQDDAQKVLYYNKLLAIITKYRKGN
jgi:hypothetical protein